MPVDGFARPPENIVDPRLTSVGIQVVRGPGGLFAVQDFSQSVPTWVGAQEQKVVSLLTRRDSLGHRTDGARKSCENRCRIRGTYKSMIRFEVTDLKKLPEDLERK